MMAHPKQVLIVVNTITENEVEYIVNTIRKNDILRTGSTTNLLYVNPRLPSCYFSMPAMSLLAEQHNAQAHDALNYIGSVLQIAEAQRWVACGKIRTEALRVAGMLNADYILASHHLMQQLPRTLLFKEINYYFKASNVTSLAQP